MPFISLTRLRIRSVRFLHAFGIHTLRTLRQVKSSRGFLTGALLRDRSFTFWTLTAWDTQESMRQYILTGDHKRAMPHLLHWCDEASVAHWDQPSASLPPGKRPTAACAKPAASPRFSTPAHTTPGSTTAFPERPSVAPSTPPEISHFPYLHESVMFPKGRFGLQSPAKCLCTS